MEKISYEEKTFHFYAASQIYPGMVSAATLATRMIEHYQPKHIVMLGIAAGFKGKSMPKGSVLIADFVANYQQGKISQKGFRRDGTGINLDADLRGHLDRSKDDIIREINDEIVLDSSNSLKAYLGPIVTGSQVVASQAIMDGIQNSYRRVVGVEMEGYAIFQAASEANMPRPIPLLIKSISDFGNEAKNDKSQRRAAYTSALFFMKFAFKELKPIDLSFPRPSGLEIVPWQHQKSRESDRLAKLLNNCESGSTVKFISITGKSFLAPQITYEVPENVAPLDPFEKAISKGVKFQGIVLDPECTEAKFRSDMESPKIEPQGERLLMRGADEVQKRLINVPDSWKKNLDLRYSQIGLGFKLWLFKNVALIEPYHFGKTREKLLFSESPLCGFSHMWIERSAPEFELIEVHFDQFWNNCNPYWPQDI